MARCTVERLMRANGWRGAVRTARVRTTVADPAAQRAPDLVDRNFPPTDQTRHVADFTYVGLTGGRFAYTAFVTSLKFGETLYLERLVPSIGSVGDAYDNALAETTIGLYKTECIRDDPPSAPDHSTPPDNSAGSSS